MHVQTCNRGSPAGVVTVDHRARLARNQSTQSILHTSEAANAPARYLLGFTGGKARDVTAAHTA